MKSLHALVTLFVLAMIVSPAMGQSQEDMRKARKLRADAAYLEMKGEKEKAAALYEESLQYVKDATISQKLAEIRKSSGSSSESDDLIAGAVYSKLDLNAYLLGYMETASIIQPLRKHVLDMIAKLSSSEPEADQAAKMVDPILEWTGLYDIKGIGLSVAPLKGKVSRTKTYLEFTNQGAKGALWKLFGKPSSLASVKLFPSTTAIAMTSSTSLAEIHALVNEALTRFAPPEVMQQKDAQFAGIKEQMGIDINALINSTSDEMFLGLTLSDTTRVSIPMPDGNVMEMPEPALLLGLKVKDASILTSILTLLEQNQMPVVKKVVGGREMVTVNLPLPVPFKVEPTLVISGDYLLLGTQAALVEEAINCQQQSNGMIATAEYKSYFEAAPSEVNSIVFLSNRFYREYSNIYTEMMTKEAQNSPEIEKMKPLLELVKTELGSIKDSSAASYSVSDREGILSVGYGLTAEKNPIVAAIKQPITLAVFLGMIEAEKGKKEANRSTCIYYNQYSITNAKSLWASENNLSEGTPTWDDLLPHLDNNQIPVCPDGGEYTIGALNEAVTCSIPEHVDPSTQYEDNNQWEEPVDEQPMDEAPMEDSTSEPVE